MNDRAWFIEYSTREWDHCYIVIHAQTRAEARKMLKKHLGGAEHKIKQIVEREDYND